MQITVVGRHFEISEPIKKYVDKKILKLERFDAKIKEAHVILEIQKVSHIAEITLFLKDFKLTATEESRDMYASIDKVLANLQKQLLRVREKIKDHQAKRAARRFVFFNKFFKGRPEGEAASAEKKAKVIRREFQSKPMSVDEACMELELFKDNFLVFRDAKTERINVVYKREDGDYGLIEAE